MDQSHSFSGAQPSYNLIGGQAILQYRRSWFARLFSFPWCPWLKWETKSVGVIQRIDAGDGMEFRVVVKEDGEVMPCD